MELKITTNPASVEKAIYLLGQAIDALEMDREKMEAFGLTKAGLHALHTFRKQLVKAFLYASKNPNAPVLTPQEYIRELHVLKEQEPTDEAT